MKKPIFAWALPLALALCSCSTSQPARVAEPEPSIYVAAQGVAAAIVASQADGGDYAPLDGEDKEFYVNQLYGMEGGMVSESAVYILGGTEAGEIAVIHLFEAKDAVGAAEKLEEYRKSRQGDFFGYAPDQAAMVGQGRVVTYDRFAALLICGDSEGAQGAFSRSFGGEWEDTPVPSTSSEGAASGPVGAPAPTEAVSPPAASAPAHSDRPTTEPLVPVESRTPFDPPLEFDMSLYDDSSVVKAFRTGDDSGLSEKDAAILAVCRKVFDESITDDMTDFQKELALHDWLVDHGRYDQTHYDPRTPLGLPDNTDPYGMLVKGYGICLGYAETFRLLMDLAGVECITVTGAAFDSMEDHAWNMVKLEGEWYCVDCTWDDPGGTTGVNVNATALLAARHRYFNVTSEQMGETDHQWDYTKIPEAAGTRFRWDGKGPLPS